MIRGTTPVFTFKLPFNVDLLAEVWVTFEQNGSEIFNKRLCECEHDGDTITVGLTQEETLKLKCHCFTQVQVRALTVDGTALASKIIKIYTDEILKDGVIA